MSSYYDSSFDGERGLFEEEDIAMILALHVNKRRITVAPFLVVDAVKGEDQRAQQVDTERLHG
jgi:hypothetical protein